jgi:hypothetical protein
VTVPRLPRVYFLYLLLTVAQPALFLVVAAGDLDFRSRGVLVVAALLLGLAFRSRLAWWLLLGLNGLPLLVTVAVAVTTRPWAWSGAVAIALLTGVALVAALASPAMRGHLARGSGRSARGAPALR